MDNPRQPIEIFKIQFSVSFCYRADYLAGVSCGNGPVGDIFGDYAAGSDHGIVSDVYARTNDRIPADPYIIAQNDLNAVLIHGVAGIGVYGMSSGIDSYIGLSPIFTFATSRMVQL